MSLILTQGALMERRREQNPDRKIPDRKIMEETPQEPLAADEEPGEAEGAGPRSMLSPQPKS